MARDVGDEWIGGSHVVRKATERVYAGGKDRRMDLIVPTWKRKRDVHDPGNYRGITILSQVPKLLERVLVAMIRRRVCDFGGNSKDSGRGEAQQTGCTS